MTKPWPPGYTPQPIEPSDRHPLRYLRMRQTALDRGNTGTMLDTFKAPAANVPDPQKARLAVPVKKGRGA